MKKSSVVFELAPFLDVILILLFLVLVQNALRVEAVQLETQETIEAAIEEFQEAFLEEMERLQQTAADFDALRLGLEEANIVSISLLRDERDRDVRQILVEATGQTRKIPLNWDALARDNAAVALNTTLAERIQKAGDGVTFIVFKFDSANIFVADHRLISIAIHNQRLHHPQLFSAELDLRQ